MINANGTTAFGILARNLNAANNGSVTVDVTQAVTGTKLGIAATTAGGGSITVTATAGAAISVANTSAAANTGAINVSVAAGKLVTATGGHGIETSSGISTGATTIQVAGQVKATGAGFAGVRAASTGGAISVLVANTGKIDPDFGVDLTTATGAMLVNNAGTIQGDLAAIRIAATGAGTASVTNSGTVMGGIVSVMGSLNGGAFTLGNTGTLNGGVSVTGSSVAASTFTNSGIWNAANLASTFSGNLINSGTANFAPGGTLTVQGNTTNSTRINLAGDGNITANGSLTNTGLIAMANGFIGNQLTVGGAFAGGGTISVDYNSAAVTADTVRINGAASGATNISLNRLGTGFVPGGFLPIVTVVPGGGGSLFASDTPFATTGFVLERFGQNPVSNTQWGLVQTVNPVAADLAGVEELGSAVSSLLDEPVSSTMTFVTTPSPGRPQIGAWLRWDSAESTRDQTTTFRSGTFTQTQESRFEITHQVLQLGADLRFANFAGSNMHLRVGVIGGEFEADMEPRGSSTRARLYGQFGGAYAILSNGALTIDSVVRREWRDYSMVSQPLFGAFGARTFGGEATAASVFASYRLGHETGLQVTPQVGYSAVDADIDRFAVDGLTSYQLEGDDERSGRFGVTIGYRTSSRTGFLQFEPFASFTTLRDLSDRNNDTAVYSAMTTTVFDIETTRIGDAMRYELGVNATDQSGRFSGSLVGSVTDGSGVYMPSVSLRMRYAF